VGPSNILEGLRVLGPVHAVRGNTDHGEVAHALPYTEIVEVGGVRVYMLHILDDLEIDPAAADIDVVVYGHTHRPKVEEKDGVLYVNPGSCGPRRFDLPVTVARMQIGEDGGVAVRLVPLSPDASDA